MFASSARAVPPNLSSAPSASWMLTASPFTASDTPGSAWIASVPFGPFTVTLSAAAFSSTPFGRLIVFLATRDIVGSLGDLADDFAAQPLGAGLRVGQQTGGRRDDRDAQTTEHLRQFILAAVDAQAGTADAGDGFDGRAALEILQLDLEHRLALRLGGLRVENVAFVLEKVGDRHLQLGRRHAHRRLAHQLGIADTRKHVGDGISHAHENILQSAPISDKTGNLLDCDADKASACVAQTADYSSFSRLCEYRRWNCADGGSPQGLPPHRVGRIRPPCPSLGLTNCLAQAGHVATHGGFAQLVAAEVELGVHGARTAGQRATGALAGRAGVARQLLQLALRFHLLLVGGGGAQHDRLQFGALGGVLLDELGPLDVAVDHRGLCHVFLSRYQLRNGKLKASSSALASASVFAVVVMAMSMPRIASTASKSISGKMICSLMPKLKLPRPSKARPETPRKSRTRGSEMLIRRSRNSNICA